MRTRERGVFCQAMTRFVTNFVVCASHSSVPPEGVDPTQCERPSPKSSTARRARMNFGKFSKSLQNRNTSLTGCGTTNESLQSNGATARAGAAQRIRHRPPGGEADERESGDARRACRRWSGAGGRPRVHHPPCRASAREGERCGWLGSSWHPQGAREVPRRRARVRGGTRRVARGRARRRECHRWRRGGPSCGRARAPRLP